MRPDAAPRWLIAAPGPQETYASILERAVERYGAIEPWWGVGTAAPPQFEAGRTIDDPGLRRIRLLAERVGISMRQMREHRLPESPLLLAQPLRRIYCPACWRLADTQGAARTFRSPWQSIFALMCDIHREVPLRAAPPWYRQMPLSRVAVDEGAILSADVRRILQWLEPIAMQMERALAGQCAWPAHWRGSAHECRLLLVLMTGHLAPYTKEALISSFYDALGHGIFGGTVPAPALPAGWDTLRTMAAPDTRRALVWVAAWFHTCPEDDVLWPPWLGPLDRRHRLAKGELPWRHPQRYPSAVALARHLLCQVDPLTHRVERLGVMDLSTYVPLRDAGMFHRAQGGWGRSLPKPSTSCKD